MKQARLRWSHNSSLLVIATHQNCSLPLSSFIRHPGKCNKEMGYQYYGGCKKGLFVVDPFFFFLHAPVFLIYCVAKFCSFQKILLKVIMLAKFLITFSGWWGCSLYLLENEFFNIIILNLPRFCIIWIHIYSLLVLKLLMWGLHVNFFLLFRLMN